MENSLFKDYTFLFEEPVNKDIYGGNDGGDTKEIDGGSLVEYDKICKGGLCIERAIKVDNPTASQFKDLIVPIGLILENRSTDLHNHFLNIDDDELQPVNESMIELLFTSSSVLFISTLLLHLNNPANVICSVAV